MHKHFLITAQNIPPITNLYQYLKHKRLNITTLFMKHTSMLIRGCIASYLFLCINKYLVFTVKKKADHVSNLCKHSNHINKD